MRLQARLEELVQQAVEFHALLIGLYTVKLKEWFYPCRPKVAFDAACREGQVLITVTDPQACAVDEAAEVTVCCHEIWQAGVTVGHHEVMNLWLG